MLGEEFAAFEASTPAYLDRFGHPFIVAVAGLSRGAILAAFAERLGMDGEAEFATAIARLAGFRLAALLGPE